MAGVGGDKVLGHTIGEGRRDEGVPGQGGSSISGGMPIESRWRL
jgi:hypothetical protein